MEDDGLNDQNNGSNQLQLFINKYLEENPLRTIELTSFSNWLDSNEFFGFVFKGEEGAIIFRDYILNNIDETLQESLNPLVVSAVNNILKNVSTGIFINDYKARSVNPSFINSLTLVCEYVFERKDLREKTFQVNLQTISKYIELYLPNIIEKKDKELIEPLLDNITHNLISSILHIKRFFNPEDAQGAAV